MKILVTGGSGFIGQHVCKRLNRPVILDRMTNRRSEYDVIYGDINDPDAVTEAMAHVDGFIHLAAVLGTQETIQNPRPAARTNIIGGLNILEAAAQYNLPGVYIGVGNHWMNNTYSISKTTVERFIDMYNKERGTRINIVRAMNAYGPGQSIAAPYGPSKVRKITPSFICRALMGDPIELYGGGYQTSDMVYVEDVAETLIRAFYRAVEGDLFTVEIGPEKHNTVREVAQMVLELTGSSSELVDLPMRPGEIPGAKVTADIRTLECINMKPSELVDLKTGLTRTIEYFKNEMAMGTSFRLAN